MRWPVSEYLLAVSIRRISSITGRPLSAVAALPIHWQIAFLTAYVSRSSALSTAASIAAAPGSAGRTAVAAGDLVSTRASITTVSTEENFGAVVFPDTVSDFSSQP